MRRLIPLAFRVVVGLLATQQIAPAIAQQTVPTPAGVQLVTEDAQRFWQVWDAHAGRPDAAALQQGYLDPGTPGLKAFLRLRIGSADELAKSIAARPDYYASLRDLHRLVALRADEFTAAFEALEALYPPAVFPSVYFLIGSMNSGGTLADEGLLIGLDMYGRQEGVDLQGLSPWHQAAIASPQDLLHIVVHELIHYQQFNRAGTPDLLQQSVIEGAADFVAELVSGSHINPRAHAYGRAHECELWRGFSPRMAGTDFSGFLYGGGDAVKGRPADLGYFIGYRIVEAFVARRGLSEATLRDVFGGLTADALLRQSGYAPCAAGAG